MYPEERAVGTHVLDRLREARPPCTSRVTRRDNVDTSMLVMPALTFSSPARRRSHTPSFLAWSEMSMALPPSMMMRPSVSVTGMTW